MSVETKSYQTQRCAGVKKFLVSGWMPNVELIGTEMPTAFQRKTFGRSGCDADAKCSMSRSEGEVMVKMQRMWTALDMK